MSQHAYGRRPDGAGSYSRSGYSRSSRESQRARGIGSLSGNSWLSDAEPESPLPTPPTVRPVRVGAIVGLLFLLLCIAALVLFVIVPALSLESSKTASKHEGMEAIEATEKAVSQASAIRSAGLTESPSSTSSSRGSTATLDQVLGGSMAFSPSQLLLVPGSKSVISVDLSGAGVSAGSATFDVASIQSAIAAIEELGDCGFVFIDTGTGRGLAYNADKEMYVASAAKAPFVYWLLSTNANLDEFENEEIQWIIEESDNGSFEDLYSQYYADGYVGMMERYNVVHEDYEGDYYPCMSARSLAAIWADILSYLRTGESNAKWLAGLLESTEMSFIRDGLSGLNVDVMNKAGWIDEEDCRSVTDAGIVGSNGHTYVMVIETSQIDDEEAEERVSDLARALFNARAHLEESAQ